VIEIPAGRYRVGLTPAEARELAEQSAAWAKEQGVDLSPNEGNMMRQAATMLDTTANVAWVEQYLLAHFPAREVELAAFAIARRPVTSREYRAFMAATGETEAPDSWRRDPANQADDVPISGVPWAIAEAYATWAGARLPFEHEWERAVRGVEHNLFPWGNEHSQLGQKAMRESYPRVLPATTTTSSEGLEGAVSGRDEWCADVSSGPEVEHVMWGEPAPLAWGRVLRGGTSLKKVIPSGVYRSSGDPYAFQNEMASIRLVRSDGRTLPPDSPLAPAAKRATLQARTFETRVVQPALAKLASSPVAREHAIAIDRIGYFRDTPGAPKIALAVMEDWNPVTAGIASDSNTWVYGTLLAAASKETIRRVPKEHGVFVWNVQYRLAPDGTLRARSVVAFRMAFDRAIHRFENRFRASEPDTAVREISEDMVRASILDAFQYYELHADSDENPFGKG
jgi:formylglycine-generating enzyme required for sulfatase activity